METIRLDNLAANFHLLSLPGGRVWFSYATPVAFHVPGQGMTVRQNVWGPTTGKHLNRIDGGDKVAKSQRVTSETFNALLTLHFEGSL